MSTIAPRRRSAEYSLPGFRQSVCADLLRAAGLVDVAVQARPTAGSFLIASRTALLPTGMKLGRPPCSTGFRFLSSSGAVSRPDAYGGLWKFDDRAAALGHLVHHRRDPLAELLLGVLALGVPRRRGDVADAREQAGPEVAQRPLGALDALGRLEDRVDLDRVVVAGRDDAAARSVSSRSAASSHQPSIWILISRRNSSSRYGLSRPIRSISGSSISTG